MKGLPKPIRYAEYPPTRSTISPIYLRIFQNFFIADGSFLSVLTGHEVIT